MLVLHPGERYTMDDPDAVLNTGKASLSFGLVNDATQGAFEAGGAHL
jgi:hypothetical protein